ncbi:MAG: 30S ribosome-binding factor RbfA [Buchnera aphidicola (Melaphis rhois)]
MLQYNRGFRVSKELQKAISWIICNSLSDPRLKVLITVLEVQISRDFKYSKIYISMFEPCTTLSSQDILLILRKSSKYIRFLLSKKVRLRIVPILNFIYDDSLIKGMKISYLINQSFLYKSKKNSLINRDS